MITRRIYEVETRQAEYPESGGRYYYSLEEIKERLPHLAPLVDVEEFHGLSYSSGLCNIKISLSWEEDQPAQEVNPEDDCDGCENGYDVCIDDDVPHPFFREDH